MMSLKEMTVVFEYMRNDNPLNKVGFLFKLNEILYIQLSAWYIQQYQRKCLWF